MQDRIKLECYYLGWNRGFYRLVITSIPDWFTDTKAHVALVCLRNSVNSLYNTNTICSTKKQMRELDMVSQILDTVSSEAQASYSSDREDLFSLY